MTVYVALLRAINVGTTGKLAMKDLVALCSAAGFDTPETYIQSGNVVFGSRLGEAKVKDTLTKALSKALKKPAGVYVRTARELEAALANNPFAEQKPNFTLIFFLDEPLAKNALAAIKTPGGEQLASQGREVFLYFPEGQGKSRLKLPFFEAGTGRNLNTVTKLLDMARARA
jgi:uncharacterized protein (DUF1697 family)